MAHAAQDLTDEDAAVLQFPKGNLSTNFMSDLACWGSFLLLRNFNT